MLLYVDESPYTHNSLLIDHAVRRLVHFVAFIHAKLHVIDIGARRPIPPVTEP
jgi:hypothetical protein